MPVEPKPKKQKQKQEEDDLLPKEWNYWWAGRTQFIFII